MPRNAPSDRWEVVVVPHDPRWGDAFEVFASELKAAFGSSLAAIHHIGSTAVAGIYAKPIIDIQVDGTSLDDLDAATPRMEAAGYEAKGEFGIPGRRYFRKNAEDGTRLCHVHAFEAGSPGAVRHLAFRDYLRAHPDIAQTYSNLKRELAVRHPDDMEAYMDGKDAFVKETERRAVEAWEKGELG